MLNACKIWTLLSLATMMLFAGCSDDVLREDLPEEEKPAGNVYIRLQMNLNSDGPAGSRAASRAGEDSTTPETTPGTHQEEVVNTVDILVFDAATDKQTDIVFLDETQVGQITSAGGLVVPIFAKQGQTVKIYAAVNMTAAMRQFFTLGSTGTNFTLSSTGNSYWDVINEFVPGSNGKQTTLETAKGCIPMTGQFKVESVSADDTDNTAGSGEITIKGHTTKDDPLSVKADVSRIVAKVHVLAKTEEHTVTSGEKVQYAFAKEQINNTESEWIGWIRLENVRYILNGTNKSTYIFPQANNTESQYPWKDRNMDLAHYRNGRMFSNYENDFMFYDGMSLHRENISPTSHFAQAEQFVKERLDNTKEEPAPTPDPYTAGLYCLENYFDTPTANSDDDQFYDTRVDAIPMITHLSIAAKLTPRSIVVRENYKDRMDGFVKEYNDNHDNFRKKYGLTAGDFTDEDATRWKTLSERYSKSKDGDYFKDEQFVYRTEFRIIKTESEADAADLINWSLMINNLWSGDDADFENGKYPASTFYVYDTKYDGEQTAEATWNQRYLYLTAGAVNAATDTNIKIKTYSVPHIGGWGYYYTYLDQLQQTVNGKTPYKASQVTRNTYYLVTVGNFGFPGGTVTRPEYIKVNTVPVGWDYSGRGDINLH